MALYISIDVDQTLLDDEGQLIPGVHQGLAQLKAKGLVLQLWSKGGAEYARDMAGKWKLTEFFTSYATKPDLAVDDLPEDAHPVCTLGVPFAGAAQAICQTIADSLETTLCPSSAVVEMIRQLQGKKAVVERRFGPILRVDTPLHPIPFFGNLESAQVLTVGLNPSSTEFEPWRQWPKEEISPDLLARRLASYFRLVNPRPHPWFGNYQEAIGILGGNYKVNAAHADLSPWSTLSPTTLGRKAARSNLLAKYNELLALGQLRWLPRIIPLCAKSVKLVIIVDRQENRAFQTKEIFRAKLGRHWSGEIKEFRSESVAKLWAWQHREEWRKTLGGELLLD